MTPTEKRLLQIVKALHLKTKRLEHELKNHDENLMAHIPLQDSLSHDLTRHESYHHGVEE